MAAKSLDRHRPRTSPSDVLQAQIYGRSQQRHHQDVLRRCLPAKLNVAYGASDDAIADYLADADAFLADHDYTDWGSPDQDEEDRCHDVAQRLQFDYNKGDIGPGHCDR